MDRISIINRIGKEFNTSNIEAGEWSYVKDAGKKETLERLLGRSASHFKLDIRFQKDDVSVLVETKQKFSNDDEKQLEEYLEEEKTLHKAQKVICILANTGDDKIKVWQSVLDDEHLLKGETVLESMEHYAGLFQLNKSNDRERVLANTYSLNELLHKRDIDERLRSQFVGTLLLHIKKLVDDWGIAFIGSNAKEKLDSYIESHSETALRTEIKETLANLLDGSENKDKKIQLLQKNVLENQKVKKLTKMHWQEIFEKILMDIYRYINDESMEGQDILNLFFIAFNKYTGKADKNQAFTPDHITEFMCRITEVDCTKKILDPTCGSGSFLVQAMVKEFADCKKNRTEKDAKKLMEEVKAKHIFGIESEETAYGLSTTNMLIHGDGNSNIRLGNCFQQKEFIRNADPDIILMNPPYNAKPITIPDGYKESWKKAKEGKEDPTKGLVFVHYLSDIVKEMNDERQSKGQSVKTVKLAALLPLSAAIGSKEFIETEKKELLKNNTLEAVFSLPAEMFYPGASVCSCCMLFTLGQSHIKPDGTARSTFFGYCRDDGFAKKKSLGRIEQFNGDGTSKWKSIEEEWLGLFEKKAVVEGKSTVEIVAGEDEWLCEAYMKTDYSSLKETNFSDTISDYVSYLVKERQLPYKQQRQIVFNTQEWKNFSVGRIFQIKNGKGITKEEIEDNPGNFEAVQSGEENNGIIGKISLEYCKEKKYELYEGRCLSIARSGSSGFTAFHRNGCVVGDSAKLLLLNLEKPNSKIYLFLRTIIELDRYKYAYGRKVVEDKLATTNIMLPVRHTKNGVFIDKDKKFSDEGYVPDWEFMESYIDSLPYADKLTD